MCAIKLVQLESEMLSGLFGGTECILLTCKSAGSHIAQQLQAQGHQKRLQLCPLTVLEVTLDILYKTLCAFFVPHADFGFLFWHLATTKTHIPSSY